MKSIMNYKGTTYMPVEVVILLQSDYMDRNIYISFDRNKNTKRSTKGSGLYIILP